MWVWCEGVVRQSPCPCQWSAPMGTHGHTYLKFRMNHIFPRKAATCCHHRQEETGNFRTFLLTKNLSPAQSFLAKHYREKVGFVADSFCSDTTILGAFKIWNQANSQWAVRRCWSFQGSEVNARKPMPPEAQKLSHVDPCFESNGRACLTFREPSSRLAETALSFPWKHCRPPKY